MLHISTLMCPNDIKHRVLLPMSPQGSVQNVARLPLGSHFTPILIHFHASYFNNSSYRLNTTAFQFTPQTLNMKSYQKLSPTSNMVGVMVQSIFMLSHKASSPFNFNIQFPMYTKFITHVYDVALNTSMHQYCVIYIAPPTGHWTGIQTNIPFP